MKKLIPIFALLLVCFYSCKKEVKKTPIQSQQPIPNSSNLVTSVIGGAHFICPNKCKGGTSDTEGVCATCKTTLSHNVAFHMSAPVNTNNASPFNSAPASVATPNAAGQYHYACAKGCAGGSDTIGKCKTCSGELAHNDAYHN